MKIKRNETCFDSFTFPLRFEKKKKISSKNENRKQKSTSLFQIPHSIQTILQHNSIINFILINENFFSLH